MGMRLISATVTLMSVVLRLVVSVVVPVRIAVIAATIVAVTVVPVAPAVVTVGEGRSAEHHGECCNRRTE